MRKIGFITAKQLSQKWGISERRIIKLCQENRISGAIKNGMVWNIPEDTMKPSDQRSKIAKYIHTQKRVIIVNPNIAIVHFLIPLLKQEGYEIDMISNHKLETVKNTFKDITIYEPRETIEGIEKELAKYYDGLILFEEENLIDKKRKQEEIIVKIANKMNCDSSIVLVRNQLEKSKLEQQLAKRFQEEIGLRINAILLDIPKDPKGIIHYNEIAEDIGSILTKFKNTTGMEISTDGGYLAFDKKGRTKPLSIGVFYKTLHHYFNELKPTDYLWCASTMLEDEWTEEPAEMSFRVDNLEAANRGVKMDRIFIFSKSKIKEFKKNMTLKIYMQSNINTMFVDYDELLYKEPELLKLVGDGWDGINTDTLLMDLPSQSKQRGYITTNSEEVQKRYDCFQKLKNYAKDLKEILK